MSLVNLYVMQAGKRDEQISFARVPNTHDLYRVTYSPRERDISPYEFQLHRTRVADYIYDLLDLLHCDMYPYDSIQVTTKHMPPVVVSTMDLEEDSTRCLLGRTVLAGLDANVVKRTTA